MLKKSIISLVALVGIAVLAGMADADVRVRGYYRSNGTYVQPHYRSNPDGNFYNNWSTVPNINPYTGRIGTRVTPPSRFHFSYGSSYCYGYRYPSYRYSYGR